MTALDQLLTDAHPAPQTTVDRLDLGDAPELLRDALLTTDASAQVPRQNATAPRESRRRRRWPLLVGVSAALAIAAVFVISSVDRIDRVSPSPSAAWAAAAVKVALAVPRLLPSDPGWKVTRADEFNVDYGEFALAKGNREVQLTWYRRDQYDSYFKDRQQGTERFDDEQVAGETAAVFRYDDSDDYFAMWKTGDHFIEARVQPDIPPEWKNKPMPAGEGMGGPTFVTHFDESSFRAFLRSLQSTTVDDWLTAMPASVVKPQDNRATIAKMLDGVPTPKGFSAESLVNDQAARDRYQLGAQVAGAVMCSWVKEWEAAGRAGDEAGQVAARRAMGTAPSWSVFKEMGEDGQAPEFFVEDALRFSKGQSPNKQMPFGTFYHRQFCQTM